MTANVASWFPLLSSSAQIIFSLEFYQNVALSHAKPLFIYQFTAKSKCSQVRNQTLQSAVD